LEHQAICLIIFFRNKAVADGAVSFCIDHYVTARVSKFAFGTDCCLFYNANNPEHTSRSDKKFIDLAGDVMIGDIFSNILPMVMFLFDVRYISQKPMIPGLYGERNPRIPKTFLRGCNHAFRL
jgi:hypothetical protein